MAPFTSPSPSPLHKTTKHLHPPHLISTSKPCNPQPNQTQITNPTKNATTKPSHPPLHPPPLPHALPTTTTTPPASNSPSNPTDPEHHARAFALPAKPLSHTTTHLHPIAARVRLTNPPRTEPQTEPREPHTAQQPTPSPTPADTSTSPRRTSTPLYPALARLSTGTLHPLDRARGHAWLARVLPELGVSGQEEGGAGAGSRARNPRAGAWRTGEGRSGWTRSGRARQTGGSGAAERAGAGTRAGQGAGEEERETGCETFWLGSR